MPQNETGSFIPLTNIWDPETLAKDTNSPESKELMVRLYQNVSNISQVINDKDTGIYDVSEFVCGQTFFPNPAAYASGLPNTRRQVYRVAVNVGPLANPGLTTVAHNIPLNEASSVTRLYGAATCPPTTSPSFPGSYIPLPYIAPTGGNIALYVDQTNVYVNTLAATTNMYTISYVIIEYLKQ